ncbi:MAG: hypothetical protein ABI594_19155 [Ginsengibacter sp.]
MEDLALKNIWSSYDNVLEKSINLNTHLLEELQKQKIRFSFRSLLHAKIFGLLIGIVCIFGAAWVLFNFHTQIIFTVSLGMIFIFNLIATIGYIRHIFLIANLNFSKSISNTQKKLATLQAAILRHFRILCLQLPFYVTIFIPDVLLKEGSVTYWTVQAIAIALFTIAAIWLYRNISYKNIHKKWLKKLIEGDGGTTVSKAIVFIEEIEEFKKEIK